MTTTEKILSMFPKKRVRHIAVELKLPVSYVVDVLHRYGLLESGVRQKGHCYGDKKIIKYPEPEREKIQRAAW